MTFSENLVSYAKLSLVLGVLTKEMLAFLHFYVFVSTICLPLASEAWKCLKYLLTGIGAGGADHHGCDWIHPPDGPRLFPPGCPCLKNRDYCSQGLWANQFL